ncbi:MAG TPA: type II CAAX endopeptidase family protein [Candidatus Binatia bacterium]|nr:type II CAAX endopeptidase family protein [Candidatus Binatia bacterium]
MQSLPRKLLRIIGAAFLAILILAIGQGIWGALLLSNLKSNPAIPWAVPVMAVVLYLIWQYLAGKGWPRSTSQARQRLLRANRVSRATLTWAMAAGLLAIVALAGIWIVFFQLVRTSPNALADFSHYPLLTAILAILMASLVSPITEEAGFRGYCQVILEGEFSGPVAVLISSILFMIAHVTHGLFWTKLLVYFLVGLVFGTIAYLSQSTLPNIPVHIIGDLTFFLLVWPHDAGRRLVWEGNADRWFWIHVAQAVVFTVSAIAAFFQLKRVAGTSGQPQAGS